MALLSAEMRGYAAVMLARCTPPVEPDVAAATLLRAARLGLHDVPLHIVIAVEVAGRFPAPPTHAVRCAEPVLRILEKLGREHALLAPGESTFRWLQWATRAVTPPTPPCSIHVPDLLVASRQPAGRARLAPHWEEYLDAWESYIAQTIPLILDRHSGLDKPRGFVPSPVGFELDIERMPSWQLPRSQRVGNFRADSGPLARRASGRIRVGGYSDVELTSSLERAAPWQFALGRKLVMRRMLDQTLVAYGKPSRAVDVSRGWGTIAWLDPTCLVDAGLRSGIREYVRGKRLTADLALAAVEDARRMGLNEVGIGTCTLPSKRALEVHTVASLAGHMLPLAGLFQRSEHVMPAQQILKDAELRIGHAAAGLVALLLIQAIESTEARPPAWSPIVVISQAVWSMLDSSRQLDAALARAKCSIDNAVTEATEVPTGCVLVIFAGEQVIATSATPSSPTHVASDRYLREALDSMFEVLSGRASAGLRGMETSA